MGLNSTIPNHEVYQYVFGSLPMLVALDIFNFVHPGRIMPGKISDFPSRKERKTYFKTNTLPFSSELLPTQADSSIDAGAECVSAGTASRAESWPRWIRLSTSDGEQPSRRRAESSTLYPMYPSEKVRRWVCRAFRGRQVVTGFALGRSCRRREVQHTYFRTDI